MKCRLKFNICELETSHLPNESIAGLFERIERAFTPNLNYAYRFWADHVDMFRDFADIKLPY